MKLSKSNTLRLTFRYLKIICLPHSSYHPKIIREIVKMCEKQVVCSNGVIELMAMQMRLKMKNRLQRYYIKIPRPRNGFKYTKYKMYLRIKML